MALALLLAACGGGGGDGHTDTGASAPPPPPVQPPAPAPAASQALGSFTIEALRTPTAHEPTPFSGQGTGEPVRYDWDFGDGQLATSTTPYVTTYFNRGGPYTVRLVVTDASGAQAQASLELMVGYGNASPSIQRAEPGPAVLRDAVLHLGAAMYGFQTQRAPAGMRYRWDLGDGTTADTPTVVHQYRSAGTYSVRLTVTDPLGRESTALPHEIRVLETRLDLLGGRLGGPGWVDGGPNALFDLPSALAVTQDNAIWVLDSNNRAIRRIAPTGAISTVIGTPKLTSGTYDGLPRLLYPTAIAADPQGQVIVIDASQLFRLSQDGDLQLLHRFVGPDIYTPNSRPDRVAAAPNGDIYFNDGETLRRLRGDQEFLVAGQLGDSRLLDGDGDQARLRSISALTATADGAVWIVDGCAVRRLSPEGKLSTLAAAECPTAITQASGNAVFISTARDVRRISLAGDVQVVSNTGGTAIGVDSQGRLITAQSQEHVVRRGEVGVVPSVWGISPKDIARSTSQSLATTPLGPVSRVAVHPDGSLWFIEAGRLLRFKPDTGELSIIFGRSEDRVWRDGGLGDARISNAYGFDLAFSPSGNILYFSDYNRLRRLDLLAQQVSTVAGDGWAGDLDGLGTQASIADMESIAVDRQGNVHALAGNSRVVRITPAGQVTTEWRRQGAERPMLRLLMGRDDSVHLLGSYEWTRLGADGRLSLQASLKVREPFMSDIYYAPDPAAIGPDGALWTHENYRGGLVPPRLQRVVPNGSPQMVAYIGGTRLPLYASQPDYEFNPFVGGLAFDPQGRLLLMGADSFSLWRLSSLPLLP